MLEIVNQDPCTLALTDAVRSCQPRAAVRTEATRVLAVLNTGTAWSRGVLRGFTASAHERKWTVLHYPPPVDYGWLVERFAPSAALIGPDSGRVPAALRPSLPLVSVALDLSADGIASVCPDEENVGALALRHLHATGLRQFSTFRIDDSRFAVAREGAFANAARQAGAKLATGWASAEAPPSWRGDNPEAMVAWLLELPKPCGIFTCADHYARILARYIKLAGLRVPEDIALVGVDNDIAECELLAPPLSSVMIDWQELGKSAARLVEMSLSGQSVEAHPLLSAPVAVVARRSSDVLAIEDELVARAVRWIRAHAHQHLNVPMVARAVGGGRQRLERRFRRALDRTVQEEIRRARVEVAKGLLQTTLHDLSEIAARSGFSNSALLSVAFKREMGMPPGVYRRRARQAFHGADD